MAPPVLHEEKREDNLGIDKLKINDNKSAAASSNDVAATASTQQKTSVQIPEVSIPHDVPNVTLNHAVAGSSPNNEPWWIERKLKADGSPVCNFKVEAIKTTVYDMRGREGEFGLDESGGTWVEFNSQTPDDAFLGAPLPHGKWEEIKEKFYPEAADAIQKVTGAAKVIIFNHLVRGARLDSGLDSQPLARHPVQRVHVDQAPATAHGVAKQYAPEDYKKYKRFQILNLWKPVGVTVYDWPLTLIDWRTIDPERDLIYARGIEHESDVKAYGKRDYSGGGFEVAANPNHKTWYLSRQTPNEALVFKNYDSASRGLNKVAYDVALPEDSPVLQDIAGTTTHSAFKDEEGSKIGIKRQSVEVRALVFYD